ncbi:MAG: M20/M25/M40 family metallo-hydrolase, partial [Calditrichaeota bacterium]|nr:M20/M25/M40 family metallo-hydrolase [Calditrichota bacterium]
MSDDSAFNILVIFMFSTDYRLFFEQILNIDCTTGREYEIGKILSQLHTEKKYRVHKQAVETNRNNIFAFANTNSEKRVLFTSHIDTVPPHLKFRHDQQTDCYYGRGACDTKGGIIAMLMAAEELIKRDYVIDFLWVIGEETDHIGAKQAVHYYETELTDHYQYQMVILCEPTGMKLAAAQKGILKAQLKFSGKMAHSGFPELGNDANRKLIEVSHLLYQKSAELTDEIYGSLDINIGLITGGQAANVVSGTSELTFLARSNSNHQKFREYVQSFESTDVTINWVSDHEPIKFDHINPDLLNEQYIAKFNTDVVFLSRIAPVYLIGPGDIIHAHSDNEHIYVKDIELGAERYCDLVRRVIQ